LFRGYSMCRAVKVKVYSCMPTYDLLEVSKLLVIMLHENFEPHMIYGFMLHIIRLILSARHSFNIVYKMLVYIIFGNLIYDLISDSFLLWQFFKFWDQSRQCFDDFTHGGFIVHYLTFTSSGGDRGDQQGPWPPLRFSISA
jgi:hypothetical protein